ncbi:MAG TPA: CvpA family protein [Actinomycetota bacterium]|nr:CvpA family protein [Actinomycetota bacterium]
MQRGLIVDLVVVAVVLFAIVRGWRNGTLREGFGLFGLIAGVLLAPALVGPLGELIESFSNMNLTAARLSALIAVVALIEIAFIVVGIRKTKELEIAGPRWLDRAGGAVLGVFRAVTVAALLLYSLLAVSASERSLPGFTEGVVDSVSGRVLADPSSPVTNLYDALLARSDDMRSLTLSVRQQTGFRPSVGSDRVTFVGAEGSLSAVEEAERELLALMNDERERRGLEPLAWCESCAEVARGHARDMYREGYFSHVDSRGSDPFDRMRQARIAYAAAGENLAVAPTVEEAHRGLLASPDHRANMLRPSFDQVGIGVVNGPYGLMCTEVFRQTL